MILDFDSTLSALTSQLEETLPYDTLPYVRTLSYLGQPATIPGLPWPVILRPIPGSDRYDAMGPWPYGSAPQPALVAAALQDLSARGVVSLVAFLRPDQPVDQAGLRQAGLDCVMLKHHFVFDSRETLPAWGKATRRNVTAARRQWRISPLDLSAAWPVLAAMHTDLAQRRSMSRIANVDPRHFEHLAQVPGITGLGAFDQDELVAALVAGQAAATVHFHAIMGVPRAYRERAFYALYDEALRRWGQDSLLYMGGVPGGPDGPGIEKFKRRFATATRPVTMIKAILDPEACAELAARQGAPGYFPPYRTPAD